MFINDFKSSNGYRLHQVLHTLKSVHNLDLDLSNNSKQQLTAIKETSELIKNDIIGESLFNSYNVNPEYAKHMLILEAVRLYLAEIAPKRSPKRKVKESSNPVDEEVISSVAPTGPAMQQPQSANNASKPATGMLTVKKGTQTKTIPAAQLATHQQQGFSVVGDSDVSIPEAKIEHLTKPNYVKLAKEHGYAARAARDSGDDNDYSKHLDLHNYYRIKAGKEPHAQVLDPDKFTTYVERKYNPTELTEPTPVGESLKTTRVSSASKRTQYTEHAQIKKHTKNMSGNVESMAKEGNKMKKTQVRESVGQMLMSMMLNEDQDLAQAQTLIAAKGLSDDLQTMAEKVAKMSVEDLMPLVDTMKDQFGPEAADGYNDAMKQSLTALLDATTSAKDASDTAITQLQSGGVPSTDEEGPPLPGVEPAPEDGDASLPSDADLGLGGEEGGEAAAPETADEEPLGRARKESVSPRGKAITEKWDATMKTKEKDKGKWDGWTLAKLKAHHKKLMDKETRTAAEQKEVKQVNFAIRAKQKDKWGDVKETKVSVTKAESFIRENKADFKKRYGKVWESRLYATAWKQFGSKSESYVAAHKMLENSLANKARLQSMFEAHKRRYAKMVNEGVVQDPLNSGYGLDGQVMLDQMGGLNNMISKLKEMIRTEIKSGAIGLMMAEQTNAQIDALKAAKAAAPYGVMWKDNDGSKQSKFFENANLRKFWLDLNKPSLNEHRIVDPSNFDAQIRKLASKKV